MIYQRESLKKVNKFPLKKQTGQILIIFLLILVVGLALVLSVASRSITDIRITTTSDESSRAYFAAEAGIEEALKQLQTDADYAKDGVELDFKSVNQTTANVNVDNLTSPAAGSAFKFPDEYNRDAVVQVSLLNNFNLLGTSSVDNPVPNPEGRLNIYYGDTGGIPPAIEVSVVHTNGTVWGIKKFSFDWDASRRGLPGGNGFCSDTAGYSGAPIPTQEGDFVYLRRAEVRFMEGYSGGAAGCPAALTLPGVPATDYPVLARIRFLYNDEPEPIAVASSGSVAWTLPKQGTEVESSGSTLSGVTRKLRVTQLYPSLPSIFDYVLFSGDDLVK